MASKCDDVEDQSPNIDAPTNFEDEVNALSQELAELHLEDKAKMFQDAIRVSFRDFVSECKQKGYEDVTYTVSVRSQLEPDDDIVVRARLVQKRLQDEGQGWIAGESPLFRFGPLDKIWIEEPEPGLLVLHYYAVNPTSTLRLCVANDSFKKYAFGDDDSPNAVTGCYNYNRNNASKNGSIVISVSTVDDRQIIVTQMKCPHLLLSPEEASDVFDPQVYEQFAYQLTNHQCLKITLEALAR